MANLYCAASACASPWSTLAEALALERNALLSGAQQDLYGASVPGRFLYVIDNDGVAPSFTPLQFQPENFLEHGKDGRGAGRVRNRGSRRTQIATGRGRYRRC